jgi:hypothetical protein
MPRIIFILGKICQDDNHISHVLKQINFAKSRYFNLSGRNFGQLASQRKNVEKILRGREVCVNPLSKKRIQDSLAGLYFF